MTDEHDDDFETGLAYYEGLHGVAQNYKKAFEHFSEAAKREHLAAQFALGLMYANSQGVPENYKESVNWYIKAAKQGHARAQYNLSKMYEAGIGVEENHVIAYMWMSIAVANGDELAKDAIHGIKNSLSLNRVTIGQDLAKRCWESGYADCPLELELEDEDYVF